jgi:hypothetical protein
VHDLPFGLIFAIIAGGWAMGFVCGFAVRSRISRARRRRWKQMQIAQRSLAAS